MLAGQRLEQLAAVGDVGERIEVQPAAGRIVEVRDPQSALRDGTQDRLEREAARLAPSSARASSSR